MTESDKIPIFFLDYEMKSQFKKTRDMIDQILETFDILENRELIDKIKQAEIDFNKGEYISLEDLKKEYSNSG